MTKLHFNYKDVFRALRLGFSAKKIWMASLGLLVGFTGYSGLTYVAYLVAGADLLTVWDNFRLLPFPSPADYIFPWYAWVIYAAAALFFGCAFLITGAAISRVCYEQLKGDEFYESREAFKRAFKGGGAVLASPLLILAFIAIIAAFGLGLSGLGSIPYVGEILVGLASPLAFVASLFIVYLLVVLAVTLLLGPSVVGATRNDTFDTLFETFSCVNEQPARVLLYLGTVAGLAKLGTLVLGFASSIAGRIGYSILTVFMGDKMVDAMTNGAFYFKVSLPDCCPAVAHQFLVGTANVFGLPQIYLPSDYLSLGWSSDLASLFLGATLYLVAIMVLGYGMSVWFSGTTIAYAVLARKKDDKNILEIPSDEMELIEPLPMDEIERLQKDMLGPASGASEKEPGEKHDVRSPKDGPTGMKESASPEKKS